MDAIKDLLEIIPEFMLYVVPGYLFFAARNFALYEEREEPTEYFLVPCIVFSYVFSTLWKSVADGIILSPDWSPCLIIAVNILKQAGAFLLAILAGLFVGGISKTGWFNRLTSALFGRTLSDNLFLELQKEQESKSQLLRIRLKDDSRVYDAQLYRVVNPRGNPILRLKYYAVYDESGKEITNHSGDENYQLVLPYSDILTLEIKEKPRS